MLLNAHKKGWKARMTVERGGWNITLRDLSGDYKPDCQLCALCLFNQSCWLVLTTQQNENEGCEERGGLSQGTLGWMGLKGGERWHGRAMEGINLHREWKMSREGSEMKTGKGEWETGHVKGSLCVKRLKIPIITSGSPAASFAPTVLCFH